MWYMCRIFLKTVQLESFTMKVIYLCVVILFLYEVRNARGLEPDMPTPVLVRYTSRQLTSPAPSLGPDDNPCDKNNTDNKAPNAHDACQTECLAVKTQIRELYKTNSDTKIVRYLHNKCGFATEGRCSYFHKADYPTCWCHTPKRFGHQWKTALFVCRAGIPMAQRIINPGIDLKPHGTELVYPRPSQRSTNSGGNRWQKAYNGINGFYDVDIENRSPDDIDVPSYVSIPSEPGTRRILRENGFALNSGPFPVRTLSRPVSPEAVLSWPVSPRPISPRPISPPLQQSYLLPPVQPQDRHKKCLVIDLDGTLVYRSYTPLQNPDLILRVDKDGKEHPYYIRKRPYVDEFLQRMSQLFECVLFTAGTERSAKPVVDALDKWGVFRARLYREACGVHNGKKVKDLSRLGRDLRRVIIIDDTPAAFAKQPQNAVQVTSWVEDKADKELLRLIPYFEELSKVDNVYTILRKTKNPSNYGNRQQPSEYK